MNTMTATSAEVRINQQSLVCPISLVSLRKGFLFNPDTCFKTDGLSKTNITNAGLDALMSTKIEAGNFFSKISDLTAGQKLVNTNQVLTGSDSKPQTHRYGMATLESKFEILGSPDTRKMCQIFYCTKKFSDGIASKESLVAKVIPNKQSSRKALQEVQILRLLNASKELVPAFVDSWIESKKTVIVMKRYHSDLERQLILDRESISLPSSRFKETSTFLIDLALTLKRLNELGYAHLDLKPENIFVNWHDEPRNFQFCSEASQDSDSSSRARTRILSERMAATPLVLGDTIGRIDHGHRSYLLADFGMAESSRNAAKFGVAIGDHTYMPLETLDIGADTSMDLHKVDIFSLGLVAFRLATNLSLPTHGSDWEEFRTNPQLLSESLARANCPPSLSSLIKRCLSRNPADRPTATEVFEEAALLTNEEVVGRL